jgi:hypothetical protein
MARFGGPLDFVARLTDCLPGESQGFGDSEVTCVASINETKSNFVAAAGWNAQVSAPKPLNKNIQNPKIQNPKKTLNLGISRFLS